MAYYLELEADSVGMAWIYNVSQTVGPYIVVRRPDVMLVQHALNTVMAPLDLRDESGKTIGYLHRSGDCDARTVAAIKAYQRNLVQRKLYAIADGYVEPSSRNGWNGKGNAQYTIVYLNRDHRTFHGKMMDEEDFPREVQADIKANAKRH